MSATCPVILLSSPRPPSPFNGRWRGLVSSFTRFHCVWDTFKCLSPYNKNAKYLFGHLHLCPALICTTRRHPSASPIVPSRVWRLKCVSAHTIDWLTVGQVWDWFFELSFGCKNGKKGTGEGVLYLQVGFSAMLMAILLWWSLPLCLTGGHFAQYVVLVISLPSSTPTFISAVLKICGNDFV